MGRREISLSYLCRLPEMEVWLRKTAASVRMPMVAKYLSFCGIQKRIDVANRDQSVPPSIDAHEFERPKVLPDLQLKPHTSQVNCADRKRKRPALIWPSFAANPQHSVSDTGDEALGLFKM